MIIGRPELSVATKRNRPTRDQLDTLDRALIDIVVEMHPITVRGVFYQAEVRELVEKTEKGYDRVQRRLVKLRRDGPIPYGYITDSSRMVQGHNRYRGIESFQSAMASLYHRDYWAAEPDHVEVWIEKDALAGTIYRTVVDEWGLDLYVNRGFTSVSYLYSAAENITAIGKPAHIYILSDFDPSGKCAKDKVAEGLRELVDRSVKVRVYDLAVTKQQIEQWNLPSRPTKTSDTRSRKFVAEHGDRSVELDAIRPDRLRELVGNAIGSHWKSKRGIARLKATEREERDVIASLRLPDAD
jgi:hypothetical protein